MRIYMTIGSIPELKDVPAKDRRRLWRAAYSRGFENWRMWAALFISTGVCLAVGAYVGALYGQQMLGSIVGAGIGGGIFGQVATHLARPHLRDLVNGDRKTGGW